MKIFVKLLIIFSLFFYSVNISLAEIGGNDYTKGLTTVDPNVSSTVVYDEAFGPENPNASSKTSSSSDKSIKVTVPENIPGANCVATGITTNKMYECTIKPGMGTLKTMIAGIIKFFLAVTVLAGVLFLVINGMMLSMMGGEKEKIKGRIVKAIVGLVLVLMSGLILSILFPWIYT